MTRVRIFANKIMLIVLLINTGFEGDEILAFVSIFPRVFNITAFQTQRFSVFLDSNFRSLFPDIQQLQISISLMEEPSFNAVITQDTSVINLIDVMIATVDVQPSEVEVSEGNAAVVCFSAMELTSFNNPVSISLILMVQNITTCKLAKLCVCALLCNPGGGPKSSLD